MRFSHIGLDQDVKSTQTKGRLYRAYPATKKTTESEFCFDTKDQETVLQPQLYLWQFFVGARTRWWYSDIHYACITGFGNRPTEY